MTPEEISEAPSSAEPSGDSERAQKRRAWRERCRRRRPWMLIALTVTAIAATCVSVLSLYRVGVLRSELSSLRSEVLRQRQEGHSSSAQQHAGKPEDGQGDLQDPGSRWEPHSDELRPKSQRVPQPCLQMIGDSSRNPILRGRNAALPWQSGLQRGTALQEEEDAILVREGGFYFIYSQVYYTGKVFAMGHVLQRKYRVPGDDDVMQAVVLFRCIQNMDKDRPHSTCYTGGVVRLEAGDRLELLIPRLPANVSLDRDTTFFGAVKLA